MLPESRTTSLADVPTEIVNRLNADLYQAIAHCRRLDVEYAELLADPGVIQEDRDGIRLMLEGARRELEDARLAVGRVEDGTYGSCAACGQLAVDSFGFNQVRFDTKHEVALREFRVDVVGCELQGASQRGTCGFASLR